MNMRLEHDKTGLATEEGVCRALMIRVEGPTPQEILSRG